MITDINKIDINTYDDSQKYIISQIPVTKTGGKLRSVNKPLSYTRTRTGGATHAANIGIPDSLFRRHGRWLSDRKKDVYVKDNMDSLLSLTRTMFT